MYTIQKDGNKMEEIGNNQYSCDDGTIYSPNYSTAKHRCVLRKIRNISSKTDMLRTQLWNAGLTEELTLTEELGSMIKGLKKFIEEGIE